MGMTSAAEAKLDARIRPEIAIMRSRTSYPKRRLAVVTEPAIGREAVAAAASAAAAGDSAAGTGRQAPPLVAADPAEPAPPVVTAERRTVPEGPIRLTRRGRIVVGAALVFTMLTLAGLLWLVIASQARAAGHAPPGQRTAGHALKRVVVRPGQTLFGIAIAADPSADPRVIVREIIDENALASTRIQVGQVLWVPRG